jgi:hypothetical protein
MTRDPFDISFGSLLMQKKLVGRIGKSGKIHEPLLPFALNRLPKEL